MTDGTVMAGYKTQGITHYEAFCRSKAQIKPLICNKSTERAIFDMERENEKDIAVASHTEGND